MSCEDALTDQEIADLSFNTRAFNKWAEGGPADTATMANGRVVPSPSKAIADARLFKGEELYDPATQYTDATVPVIESNIVYAPTPSLLPIGPEAFDSSKWYILQGGGILPAPLDDLKADGSFLVGQTRQSSEYNTGSGDGDGVYEKVSIDPGNIFVNPSTSDGNWLLRIRDRDIFNAACFGVVYDDLASAANNGLAISQAIGLGFSIDFTDIVHMSGSYTINTGFLSFSTSNGEGEISYTSNLFTFGNIDGIEITGISIGTGTASSAVTFFDTVEDALIPFMRLNDCPITGEFRIRYKSSLTLNPEVVNFGIRYVEIVNCTITEIEGTMFIFSDMPYNIMYIARNTVRNFNYVLIYDGVQNGSTFESEMSRSKKELIVEDNNIFCDDSHFGDPEGDVTSYHVFILTEAANCLYTRNHAEGLKVEAELVACYDIYGSSIVFNYKLNTWKNIVNTNPANLNRALFKPKGSRRASATGNTFLFDDDYFTRIGKSGASIDFLTISSDTDKQEVMEFSDNICEIYRLRPSGNSRYATLKCSGNTITIKHKELGITPRLFGIRLKESSTPLVDYTQAVSISNNTVIAPDDAQIILLGITGSGELSDLGDLSVCENSMTAEVVRLYSDSMDSGDHIGSWRNVRIGNNSLNGSKTSDLSSGTGRLSRAKTVSLSSNLSANTGNGLARGAGLQMMLCDAVNYSSVSKTNYTTLSHIASFKSPAPLVIDADEVFKFACDTKLGIDGTITNIRTAFDIRLESSTNEIFIDFNDSGGSPVSLNITNITGSTTSMETTSIGDGLNPKPSTYSMVISSGGAYIQVNANDGLGDQPRTYSINLYSI